MPLKVDGKNTVPRFDQETLKNSNIFRFQKNAQWWVDVILSPNDQKPLANLISLLYNLTPYGDHQLLKTFYSFSSIKTTNGCKRIIEH